MYIIHKKRKENKRKEKERKQKKRKEKERKEKKRKGKKRKEPDFLLQVNKLVKRKGKNQIFCYKLTN